MELSIEFSFRNSSLLSFVIREVTTRKSKFMKEIEDVFVSSTDNSTLKSQGNRRNTLGALILVFFESFCVFLLPNLIFSVLDYLHVHVDI